jgi:biotin transporter BioY
MVDWSFLTRKKKYDAITVQQTQLSRVLKLRDISAIGKLFNVRPNSFLALYVIRIFYKILGISCTLGNGVYVLAGTVIGQYTGPAIVFSFLLAGLITFIAGINQIF